jgi:hypothetical protein
LAIERQKVDASKITPLLRHKWPGGALDEGFVPFPKRLLRCTGRVFSGKNRLGQLRVVLAIVDNARPDLKWLPNVRYLAFATGMSRARVVQCLDELAARKLLTWEETPEGLKIDYAPLVRRIVRLTEDD